MENPFRFGSPITCKQQFFGREALVRRIVNRLRSMQDSSVIGERRMGKTSLLYHLIDPVVAERHGLDPSQYVFVYFSFEGGGGLTPSRFWQRLLRSLSERIADLHLHEMIDRLSSADEIDLFDVEDLFLEISGRGFRVVFLLDEFETVTQARQLDADFFSHLRSLATGRYIGLIFVTSSRQKLSEISHAGIVGSPFFNIFETFFLQPFELDEAESLVTSCIKGTGITFEAEEQAYLLALSGGHPYLLQMAASYLFDAHATQRLDGARLRPARLERVERNFIAQAEPHFEHYWSQSTHHERIFLASLACLRHDATPEQVVDMETMKLAYRDADVAARVLGDHGMVLRVDAGFQVMSPTYQEWIVRELTRRDNATGHDSYQSWLKQNEAYSSGPPQVLYERGCELEGCVSPRYWDLVTDWLTRSDDPGRMLDLIRRVAVSGADRPIWLRFVAE